MPSDTVVQRSRFLEPGRLVELYEIDLSPQGAAPPDTPLYLHPYNNLEGGTLLFMGHVYQPFPIQSEGWDWNTQGTIPRPKVVVANIGGIVTALLRLYGDFVGCVVTRRRTYTDFLDDGPAPDDGDGLFSIGDGDTPTPSSYKQYDPDVFTIERKTQETSTFIEFELTSAFDAETIKLPRRQILSTYCPWLYRGVECGYAGPPVADKEGNPIVIAPGAVEFDDDGSYGEGDWVYVGVITLEVPGPPSTAQYYRSLVSPNTFDVSDATKWFHTGQEWNGNKTYVLGDFVYVMVNGIRVYYGSLANGNDSLLTDKTKWVRDDCSKQLTACKARFGANNPLPYGGFPGAGKIPAGAAS